MPNIFSAKDDVFFPHKRSSKHGDLYYLLNCPSPSCLGWVVKWGLYGNVAVEVRVKGSARNQTHLSNQFLSLQDCGKTN